MIASPLPFRPAGEAVRRRFQLASAAAGTAVLSFCLSLLCFSALAQPSGNQGFTLRQVMSAPFDSDLTAAPAGDAFAWVANAEGKRNLWVAVRSPGGEYVSHSITDYPIDDGQDISDVTWSPDAKSILYVRGGSSDNPEKRAPNPAYLPGGAEQDVWLISADGGPPRKVAPGTSPTFSPSGDTVTWFAEGQIWYQSAAGIGSKPPQSVHVYGDCTSFTWSPDGTKLAFVSDRESHSFIGIYSQQRNTLNFVDPGTGHDRYPMWSPDSREIAFLRVPYSKEENFDAPQRSGQPWSIRVADAATGKGREVWMAAPPGQGSVFRALDANRQVFWMADDHLIFPWESDGWLHFYAISLQGGSARLLTPGDFEVENAALSPDHRFIVFSSNQGDSERRHIWKISAAGAAPEAVTHGDGIETQPVIASDNRTIVVMRSDARIPIRPAIVTSSHQLRDLAPQLIPAEFPARQMVVPQPVVYSATDGMQIHGDLFLPSEECRLRPSPRHRLRPRRFAARDAAGLALHALLLKRLCAESVSGRRGLRGLIH